MTPNVLNGTPASIGFVIHYIEELTCIDDYKKGAAMEASTQTSNRTKIKIPDEGLRFEVPTKSLGTKTLHYNPDQLRP